MCKTPELRDAADHSSVNVRRKLMTPLPDYMIRLEKFHVPLPISPKPARDTDVKRLEQKFKRLMSFELETDPEKIVIRKPKRDSIVSLLP